MAWTLWVVLMMLFPVPFANDLLRAIVRVSVVLLPALVFAQRVRQQPLIDYLHLRHFARRGVLVGGLVTLIYLLALGIALFTDAYRIADPPSIQMPMDVASWLNAIIGSPFAEEVLYRAIIFQELSPSFGTLKALVGSTSFFVLLHVPVWILLDKQTGSELLASTASVVLYGVIFGVLFRATRSLWAPIIPHWFNNLAAVSMGS